MTAPLASMVLAIAVGAAIISGQPTPDQRQCTFSCPVGQPVCGTNGLTYASTCELARAICLGADVAIDHQGVCSNQDYQACSASQQAQCGNQLLVPAGQTPCFADAGTGNDEFVCNCGVTASADFQIGRQCLISVDRSIPLTSLQSCYGCSRNYVTSINYPDPYENRRGDVYLIFVPGALEIQFSFSGVFGVEEEKDDLFVGAGLEFEYADIEDRDIVSSGSGANLIYFFDDRAVIPPNSVPAPFTIPGDSAWVYFATDRNILGTGFNLTWQVFVDNDPPVIDCPGTQVRNIDISNPGLQVFFTEPSATDNSGTAILVSRSAQPGDFFSSGPTEVTYVFRDTTGNEASCTFLILIIPVDTDPPVIDCPGVLTGTTEVGNEDEIVFFDEPTATDNSGTAIRVSRTSAPGDSFIIGRTAVTYTFSDPSGNTAVCTFDVLLITVDTMPPIVVNCPDDIETSLNLGPSVSVTWNTIIAFDNSGDPVTEDCTAISGQLFPFGLTTVFCSYTDQSGNAGQCGFNIRVSTGSITQCCPDDITEEVPFGQTGLNVPYELTCDLSGNPNIDILSTSHQSGQRFPVGDTEVLVTLVDVDNFQSSCSFTIRIVSVDTDPPEIDCPVVFTGTTEVGNEDEIVFFDEPTATDNSGTAIRVSRTSAPGDSFIIGRTPLPNMKAIIVFEWPSNSLRRL